MKKTIYLLISLFVISCVEINSQVIKNIDASVFESSIKKEDAVILDVRTAQEFRSGHIQDATNIDFYADDFLDKLKIVRKEVPIYVYCRSGGRSTAATRKMKALGFTQVYNLVGGIGAWKAKNYPITKSKYVKKLSEPVFTSSDIDSVLKTNEIVLMSFTTQWCVPCKKMKPITEEIKKENPNIKLIYIDADANKELMSIWDIAGVPSFIVFKNSKDVFRQTGLMSKQELLNNLGLFY